MKQYQRLVDKVSDLVQAARRGPATRAANRPPAAPPPLAKEPSAAIADGVRRELQANKQRFLVADLRGGEGQPAAAREEPAVSCELLDSRLRFLEACRHRHWQFDELQRAQWSTMMLLASLPAA